MPSWLNSSFRRILSLVMEVIIVRCLLMSSLNLAKILRRLCCRNKISFISSKLCSRKCFKNLNYYNSNNNKLCSLIWSLLNLKFNKNNNKSNNNYRLFSLRIVVVIFSSRWISRLCSLCSITKFNSSSNSKFILVIIIVLIIVLLCKVSRELCNLS